MPFRFLNLMAVEAKNFLATLEDIIWVHDRVGVGKHGKATCGHVEFGSCERRSLDLILNDAPPNLCIMLELVDNRGNAS